MRSTWVVRLAQADVLAAAALRLHAGVEALQVDGEVWIRGEGPEEELEKALRKIPCAERYTQVKDGRLVAWGARVPSARVPSGDWKRLAEWMTPAPQTPLSGGAVALCVPLRIVRSEAERESSLLVTDARCFLDWATQAPAARLRPLRFALSADERMLVRGTPVPPVNGRFYTDVEGIAVPCGFAWQPAVEPSVVRQVLSLAPGDLALFGEDGSWERVPEAAFVRATRSAVRMSVARE